MHNFCLVIFSLFLGCAAAAAAVTAAAAKI